MALRTRLLNTMAQLCRKYAHVYNLAFCLTNQMTTKVGKKTSGMGDSSMLVPALGESWGHACTSRVILFWQNGSRKAWLAKSPHLSERVVVYSVTVRLFILFKNCTSKAYNP